MTSRHRSFPFGSGVVVLTDDGAVAAVRHPDGRPMLLEETAEARFHDSTRRGAGASLLPTTSGTDSTGRGTWSGAPTGLVMAQPMDGSGPILGLTLTAGELWAYTVESRDEFTSSNIRGHLYLHVTDRSRAPHTFGGQPRFILQPGEEYRLGWTLAWYSSVQQFRSQQTPSLVAARYTAEVGESITLHVSADVTSVVPGAITSPNPGVHYVDATRAGHRSRIAVHSPWWLRSCTFSSPPARSTLPACPTRSCADASAG